MNLIVEKDYDSLSKRAAQMVKAEIDNKKDLVLGLATGSTPIGMYKELVRMNKEEEIDFSKVTTFNLDEYIGLDHDNPNSYHYFMMENLLKHINIDKNNIFIPDGNVEDTECYCNEYDKLIEDKGGIDLQIVGIGINGHIGFNEPDQELCFGTNVAQLSETTVEANSRFFDSIDQVPKTAVTMGMGSIMKAKKIILLANGKSKADTINKLLNGGKLSTKFPASILLLHRNLTIIVDEEAYG